MGPAKQMWRAVLLSHATKRARIRRPRSTRACPLPSFKEASSYGPIQMASAAALRLSHSERPNTRPRQNVPQRGTNLIAHGPPTSTAGHLGRGAREGLPPLEAPRCTGALRMQRVTDVSSTDIRASLTRPPWVAAPDCCAWSCRASDGVGVCAHRVSRACLTSPQFSTVCSERWRSKPARGSGILPSVQSSFLCFLPTRKLGCLRQKPAVAALQLSDQQHG